MDVGGEAEDGERKKGIEMTDDKAKEREKWEGRESVERKWEVEVGEVERGNDRPASEEREEVMGVL